MTVTSDKRYNILNQWSLDLLFNWLFRLTTSEISKLRNAVPLLGESTRRIHPTKASNVENVPMPLRHYALPQLNDGNSRS